VPLSTGGPRVSFSHSSVRSPSVYQQPTISHNQHDLYHQRSMYRPLRRFSIRCLKDSSLLQEAGDGAPNAEHGKYSKEDTEDNKDDESIGKFWKSEGRLLVVNGTLELKGRQGYMLQFEGGARGVFLWERSSLYYVYLLSPTDKSPVILPSNGENAYLMDKKLSFTPSMSAANRSESFPLIDMFGIPINSPTPQQKSSGDEDTISSINKDDASWPIFNETPKQSDLQTIRRSLVTGMTAVDALSPMGMGQNMIVLGNEKVGKSSLAVNTAIAQRNTGVKVIYACLTGQDEQVHDILRAQGALEYTTIVVPKDSMDQVRGETTENFGMEGEIAARQIVAASTAVSMGEHIRQKGGDALVILDDLRGHQDMWRFICESLLDASGGVNVFQGADDSAMRQYYSGLFQRVGKFNNAKGAGSLSMMMILETVPPPEPSKQTFVLEDFEREDMINEQTKARIRVLMERGVTITREVLQKLDIPPPGTRTVETLAQIQDIDALISLSDGHITIDEKAFKNGRKPAIDPSNSLTRVGIGSGPVQGQAFAPVILKVAPRMRLDMAQMVQDKDEVLGEELSNRIAAWEGVLSQPVGEVRSLAEIATTLYAVAKGKLDHRAKEEGVQGVRKCTSEFWNYIEKSKPEIVKEIQETQDIGQDNLDMLSKAMNDFFSNEKVEKEDSLEPLGVV